MANLKTSFQLLSILLSLQIFLKSVSLEAITLSANSSHFNAGCIDIEREALIKFKADLKDPSGRLSSWVGKDCCSRLGVGCSRETGNIIMLDLKNRFPYTFINLEGDAYEKGMAAYRLSCLGGNLNPSLLELKYLYYLDLSFNNFQGLTIPSFIGSLSELTYLDLSSSSFFGLVPPHLGNLSNLRYLNLNSPSVLNISSYFQNLPHNYHVSDLNWITRLSHLEYLNLAYINLSSASPTWLQDINMLPSLSQLHLPFCNLYHFPQTLPMMNFSSLLLLDLEGNEFNTTIPQWLFNISTLMYPDLANCKIQGRLSNNDGRTLCNLKGLFLSDNKNTGEMTDFLESMSMCSNSSLEMLIVTRNRLSGQIPESIGKFKYLRTSQLGGNSFSGSIPLSIGNLSFLEDLSLNGNEMNGTIPDTIRQLSGLVSLDLAYNSWRGVVSEDHLSGLAKLKYFTVSSHRQSLADLRNKWIPAFSLKVFRMYDCHWGSTFPSWLKTQKNLSGLALANAGISGIIPDWVWKLSPQLGLLDLSSNQLEGELPSALQFKARAVIDLSSNRLEGPVPVWFNVSYLKLNSNLFSGVIPSNFFQEVPFLRSLYLSDNLINGSIPTSISRENSLQFLDLSRNQLSGNLHIPWKYLPDMIVINLSNNSLSGEIPPSICSCPYLQVLALFGNNLSGVPYLALRNCTELDTLDLGENGFSGSIPKWVGKNLLRLQLLSLRGNMFSGNIPPELCGLPALHVMDLAHNIFFGFIPPCLGNLSGLKTPAFYQPYSPNEYTYYSSRMVLVTKGRQLEYMHILSLVNLIDFSRNSFRGEIPEKITSLAYLGTLNLSQNQLTGKIPENIGELQRLETLDISLNHLSGSIPPSMSSMTLLSSLNLSYNNLSGPIPSANQFKTLNDPSIYEGNSQLCGSPLPTNCSTSTKEDSGFSGDEGEDESWIDMWWFYIALAPGFSLGFWVVCGTLILKKRWRYAYFRFVDRVKDRTFVVFTVSKARLQRKLGE
ncbi:receptor-like protein EIX2 [Ricinus communis]|uniref:Serine-threonine protein kinase, plant-type, putative n=1 Tax=Ricinus communis TaxID=3988 RepID=B9RMH0_RICCO|nr:receptor-like protein EIX2 [Ricinus communis]EEF47493.1 serine-threonine protein kinase, plant-type, putative [Ricinus communis]|eukprot:XP_002514939.1 receptor-like protein EIX2 [Ricinus communis]